MVKIDQKKNRKKYWTKKLIFFKKNWSIVCKKLKIIFLKKPVTGLGTN